jgi:hypothetical protein
MTRREATAAAAGVAGLALIGGPANAAQAPKEKDGSEFILKLTGIKLPAEAEKRIAAELQSTLLRELGRVDLKPGLAVRIPNVKWLGIWIERVAKPTDIPTLRATEER